MAKQKGLKISSRAPVRVDLAGGTVDIWPIHLFLEDPLTINAGIDLFAEASLTASIPKNKKVSPTLRWIAEDQNAELQATWADLEKGVEHVHPPQGLKLHVELLRYFFKNQKPVELEIRTRAKSPAGAGLGGSSALSVALIGVLASWARGGKAVRAAQLGEQMIDIARDIETRVIAVPAGLQDYYGAMYGGLQSIAWDVARHRREALPVKLLKQLESRMVVFYSGQSRNSGINNWALFKAFIDKDPVVRGKFSGIVQKTHALRNALLETKWESVVQAIRDEWSIRHTLAPGISTPEIDTFMSSIQKLSKQPLALKVCGAGGGGCFFVLMEKEDPELRRAFVRAAEATGTIRHLPVKFVPHGLEVRVSRG